MATTLDALAVADGPIAVFRDAGGETLTFGTGPTVGWSFLAAQGVPINVTAERWRLAGELVQSPVVYAVPPVTPAVGGYLVARLDGRDTPLSGARAGALVVLVAVFWTRVSVQSSSADITVRPDVAVGLALGVASPVVLAGFGGGLPGLVRGRVRDGDLERVENAALGYVALALLAAVAVAAL